MFESPSLFQRKKSPTRGKYFLPRIEELEPRCVLSALQPNGGIVAGPDGNIWFNDFNGVTSFNPTTQTFHQFDQFVMYLQGITVGPDGNIWFTQGNQIGKINPMTGASQEYPALRNWWNSAEIISGIDGNLWFGDGNLLGRFNPSTGGVTTFTAPSGGFDLGDNLSGGIVSASDGSIWFSQVARQIDRLDPNTGAIQVYPFPGIYGSVAMTTGPDGSIWFVVGNAGIIKKVDPSSGAMQDYSAPGAKGMTFGPDGNVWFTYGSMFGGGVGRLNPTTGEIKTFDLSGILSLGGPPDGPITVGPDGALWFTCGTGIGRFDISSGTFQAFTLTGNSGTSGGSGTTPGVPPSPGSTNSPVTVGVDFTRVVASLLGGANPLPASAFSAAISWGDGQTTAGSIAANSTGGIDVTGTHNYSAAGTYSIKILITIGNGAGDLAGSTITVFTTIVANPLDFQPFQ